MLGEHDKKFKNHGKDSSDDLQAFRVKPLVLTSHMVRSYSINDDSFLEQEKMLKFVSIIYIEL